MKLIDKTIRIVTDVVTDYNPDDEEWIDDMLSDIEICLRRELYEEGF